MLDINNIQYGFMTPTRATKASTGDVLIVDDIESGDTSLYQCRDVHKYTLYSEPITIYLWLELNDIEEEKLTAYMN